LLHDLLPLFPFLDQKQPPLPFSFAPLHIELAKGGPGTFFFFAPKPPPPPPLSGPRISEKGNIRAGGKAFFCPRKFHFDCFFLLLSAHTPAAVVRKRGGSRVPPLPFDGAAFAAGPFFSTMPAGFNNRSFPTPSLSSIARRRRRVPFFFRFALLLEKFFLPPRLCRCGRQDGS